MTEEGSLNFGGILVHCHFVKIELVLWEEKT